MDEVALQEYEQKEDWGDHQYCSGEQDAVVRGVLAGRVGDRATGSVYFSSVWAATNGHRKLFQEDRNVRMDSVASGGPHWGRTIWKNMRSSPAPSTLAASISASGIPEMNCLIRKTPMG